MKGNSFPLLANYSKRFNDDRGYLDVLYESQHIVLKRSFSKKGVFRGMHIQVAPYLQTKLIRVVDGRIIDFLVDFEDKENNITWKEITPVDEWVKIAPNYAHGFYAMEDTTFEYICDGEYKETSEISFSIFGFLEQEVNIKKPLVSDKDLHSRPLAVTVRDK